MADEINTGGPAYPITAGHEVYSGGMTLRDWFAGQCLRDFFAALYAAGSSNFNDYQVQRCAEAAYKAADAMIRAREVKS